MLGEAEESDEYIRAENDQESVICESTNSSTRNTSENKVNLSKDCKE